ncbi:MAG: signal peptidase I [Endomicrobiales bacterium]|nr:signal peptidase I [Endomicrobiales bacterium]
MGKRLLKLVTISVFIAILLRLFVIEGIYPASESMEPTLYKNNYYFLEKVSKHFTKVKRGDIVVFPSPVKENRDLIKRIIAVSGDEILIKNKAVFLNGRRLNEGYVKHTRANELLKGDNLGPLLVPKGKVFVMGDNRDESGDSRDWKDLSTGEPIYFISTRNIKGKIILFF